LKVEETKLQSVDISMLWGEVHLQDTPTSMPPKLPSSEPLRNEHPQTIMSVAIVVDDDVERTEMSWMRRWVSNI